MKDIREIVQAALDAVFFGTVKVEPEDVEGVLPDEYITHSVVSGVYTDYANGRPIKRRDNVDVSWYGKNNAIKMKRMSEIEAAMTAAGFRVVELPFDLSREDGADYYGATMEFSLHRVVT